MHELIETHKLHKQCDFKDKDIAKAFERRCTPQNVKELFRLIDALRGENDRLQKRLVSFEQTYINKKAKGCNP